MHRSNRRKIYPPLIILLDVLFIFLFVSILEKPTKLNFQIPEDKLFIGAYIAIVDDLGNLKIDAQGKNIIFDTKSSMFINSYGFLDDNHGYFFSLPCGNQLECQQARKITNEKLNIVITGQTYDEISRLTFIGASIDPGKASNIHFTIKANGKVNIPKLVEDNQFFKQIEGFKKS
jgi:hypothetical protein